MSADMIRVRRDGPIATLALCRPEARNALPIAGWDALADALDGIGAARAVILRSDVPGIFSAGADIGEFTQFQAEPALRPRFRQAMRRAVDAVAALPMPVIAAVDGGCFGAAVALALAADIRVAGDEARFAVTPARLGLGYPQEDVARLVDRVGRGTASLLLFTGEALSPDVALAAGLVERRAEKAEDAAHALAASIVANAPDAVRLLKRTIAGGEKLNEAFDQAFGGIELAEGLAAFSERRKARF
jgi:enoyl-CoA hydratase/carnithine racemase